MKLLEQTPLEPQQSQYVTALKTSSNRLLHLINDVLDYSKIEAGQLEMEAVEFNPSQAISETCFTFRHLAKDKGLDLICDIDPKVVRTVRSDPSRFCQVLANLLSNAVKFTDRGKIEVVASSSPKDGTEFLTIHVKDTGCGIDASQQATLFTPFHRDSVRQGKKNGAGLGLTICKMLVEQMGGLLNVQSESGKGSDFWYTLPLHGTGEEMEVDRPQTREAMLAEIAFARILVVDDIDINRIIAVTLLENAGFKTDGVNSGEMALEALDSSYYDLVLMDCHMPVLDGFAATEKLRKDSKVRINSLPVVAMTASSMKGDRERCLAVGMNDYIAKPIDENALIAIVRKWLPPNPISNEVSEKWHQDTERATNHHRSTLAHYFSEVPTITGTIRMAFIKMDYNTISLNAKLLQAETGKVGAHILSGMAQQLQAAADRNDIKSLGMVLDKIDEESNRVSRTLTWHSERLERVIRQVAT